ncbi:unnamed protein product [Prorocentrum cordatum]|uniref:Uncharacterized protein n=1 Tax=Prorocentrum cordatum TaxID=2364126 RepID=A0ABN9X7G6_9DINO|nr:unnamed protein product [Polarella glacialis]
MCRTGGQVCETRAADAIFCELLGRSHPALAQEHCAAAPLAQRPTAAAPPPPTAAPAAPAGPAAAAARSAPVLQGALLDLKRRVTSSKEFQEQTANLANTMGCGFVKKAESCSGYVSDLLFCLQFAGQLADFQDGGGDQGMPGAREEQHYCSSIDQSLPALSMVQPRGRKHARKYNTCFALLLEMTHDLEMNFNKIAPFGKEDTAKELQDHAAKTQDTLVDAVENAEVAEIKRAVFRALTRLRAATIKEPHQGLETQAIDAYNDAHHYRAENPLAHLHEDEAPVETDKLKSFH